MARWSKLAAEAPEIAAHGKQLIYQHGVGLGYLATVDRDGAPRLHPFCPVQTGEGLYGLIGASPKQRDLARDGRFGFHTFPHKDADEFYAAGASRVVEDETEREAVRRAYLETGAESDGHEITFEFQPERALSTTYLDADRGRERIPLHRSWRDPAEPRPGSIATDAGRGSGASWAAFEAAEPGMAEMGSALLRQPGRLAYLATLGREGLPRVHPVAVAIVAGRLCARVFPSPKLRDLLRDGRFALHSFPLEEKDDEFFLRGRALPVPGEQCGDAFAPAVAGNGQGCTYFELLIERALTATYKPRTEPDFWPPAYRAWHAPWEPPA
jgi:hypothetical protein